VSEVVLLTDLWAAILCRCVLSWNRALGLGRGTWDAAAPTVNMGLGPITLAVLTIHALRMAFLEVPQEFLPMPSSDYARTRTLTRDNQRCRSGRAPVTGDTGCQLVYGPTISASGLTDLDHWCIFALCPPGGATAGCIHYMEMDMTRYPASKPELTLSGPGGIRQPLPDLLSKLTSGRAPLSSMMLELASAVGEKEPKLPGCSSIGLAASRIQAEHWASVVQAVFSPSQRSICPAVPQVLKALSQTCTRVDPHDAAQLVRYQRLSQLIEQGTVNGAVRRPIHHMDSIYHDSSLDYRDSSRDGTHLDEIHETMPQDTGALHGSWPAMVCGWPAWPCVATLIEPLDWKSRSFDVSFSLSGRWPRRSDGSGGAEWEMEKVPATQVLFADKCVFQLVREIQGFN